MQQLANQVPRSGDVLETELITPGSTLYYAFRRLPDHHRLPCLGLFGLYYELRGLLFSHSETVYVQFAWWYEELERMLAGKPRHPVTQAISPWQYISEARPLDWMTKLEPLLGVSHFNDEQELLEFCVAAGAPVSAALRLLSDTETDKSLAINDFLIRMAVAYTLVDFLQNLGKYLRDGIVPIPRSELAPSCTRASELLAADNTPTFFKVMQTQYNRVENTLTAASAKLSANQIPKQYVALMIAEIHKAILREIQRSNYDVVKNYIDITPLRKAWIAWNTYRKVMRHASV